MISLFKRMSFRKADLEKAKDRLGLVRMALTLVWSVARRWVTFWGILLLIQGLLPAAVVYLTKWLVDSVAAAVGAGATWETIRMVLPPAALMVGAMVLQRLAGSLNEWIRTAQVELVQDHIKGLIHRKATEVDYAFYESADYYDKLEQANSQAGGRILALLQNVGGLVQSSITLVSIAAVLLSYSVWLPVALIVSTAPAFLAVLKQNRRYHAWWTKTTQTRRWAQYYDVMLTLQGAAAEVRLYNLGEYFGNSYKTLREQLRTEHLSLLRRQTVAHFVSGLLALVVTGVTMAWIAWRALRGLATLGDLALFYQAFNQAQALLGTFLHNVGQVYTNTLFLEHLSDFLKQENTVRDPADPVHFPRNLREGVRFENVEFRYPGSQNAALENFSLHVPAGQVVAIVGENGAGKSTLIKLLCRFYDPARGRVLVDGVDLRRFRQADLRRHISVMFQFPMKYQATAATNILLGDREVQHPRASIEAAARAASADEFISRLPQQYDTLLGRWFAEGCELSGGEWQRLALARAFLREAPLVILDEPTSFMDSWAENEWLKRFRELVRNRTALIITHRFSTAMQADVIYVMDQGRIVECGSHAELLMLGGRYATSWRTQMEAGQVDVERS